MIIHASTAFFPKKTFIYFSRKFIRFMTFLNLVGDWTARPLTHKYGIRKVCSIRLVVSVYLLHFSSHFSPFSFLWKRNFHIIVHCHLPLILLTEIRKRIEGFTSPKKILVCYENISYLLS